jgi:hypothetical protein
MSDAEKHIKYWLEIRFSKMQECAQSAQFSCCIWDVASIKMNKSNAVLV